eukprot:scaffold2907_cov161-Amphora_coffeaeformis.AAC.8
MTFFKKQKAQGAGVIQSCETELLTLACPKMLGDGEWEGGVSVDGSCCERGRPHGPHLVYET